eukprot:5704783-Pleurochrysis_carterae.AAC.4
MSGTKNDQVEGSVEGSAMASIAGSGDSGTTEPPVSFTVVHNRVEHLISLPSAATVGDLREELMHRTSVSRANQANMTTQGPDTGQIRASLPCDAVEGPCM